jgi:hypothetical protein
MAADPNQQPGSQRDGPPDPPVRGHEREDANAYWILAAVFFLFVLGFSIQGILAAYLSLLNNTPPPTDRWQPVARLGRPSLILPPGPQLQVSPPEDLQAFRSREEAELNTYGWINRTSGIVRIPIERAIDLVLQEGLPARSQTNESQVGPSSYQLIQQRPEHREPEIKGEK